MDAQMPRPQGTVFGVVLGFVVGVLVAALVLPDHPGTRASGTPAVGIASTDQGAGSAGLSYGQDAAAADAGAVVGSVDPAAPVDQGPVGDAGGAAPAVGGSLPGAVAVAPGTGAVGNPAAPGVPSSAASRRAGSTGVAAAGPGGRVSASSKPGAAPARTAAGQSTAGGRPAGASASAPVTATGGGGAVRGVTADSVTIGVAYPDLSALRSLGPEYDNGNVPAQWEALLADLKQRGVFPLAGRTVKFVYRSYQVLDANDQNAACRGLIEDDKVFAVIGVAYFKVGSACVSQQFQTPLLTADGPSDAEMRAGAPYLYSLSASDSKVLRNSVRWADARGLLRGKRIGVYYLSDAASTSEAQQNVIGELKRIGYDVVAQDSTSQSLGGPQDAIAVQKFQQARVDLAILLTSKAGFLQQARALGYKPTYIESDHDFGTSDVATSNYPADQWDGTFAMTGRTAGEAQAGAPLRPDAEACVRNYEARTNSTVGRPGPQGHQSAVFSYVLLSCDFGKVLVNALRTAGSNLTPASMVTGIRSIRGLVLAQYSPVDFTSSPDGATAQRTLRWSKDCTCWRAVGDFGPFYVP